MLRRVAVFPLAATALCLAAAAQQPPPAPPAALQVPVTIVRHTSGPDPQLADLVLRQSNTPVAISGWVRDTRPVELYLAIDDDSNADLVRRLDVVRNFIRSLPDSVSVGLAYLSLNSAQIAAPLSSDHVAVAKEVRPPKGLPGISPSPFDSIAALLTQWPAKPNTRRELVVFSDGAQHADGGTPDEDPVLLKATALTQQAGVVAYGIVVRGAGDPMGFDEGDNQPGMRVQNGGLATPAPRLPAPNAKNTNPNQKNTNPKSAANLGREVGGNTMNAGATPVMQHLTGEANLRNFAEFTGGACTIQAGQMFHIDTFLNNVALRLRRQYILTFAPLPGTASGPVPIKVESKIPGVALQAPAVSFIP